MNIKWIRVFMPLTLLLLKPEYSMMIYHSYSWPVSLCPQEINNHATENARKTGHCLTRGRDWDTCIWELIAMQINSARQGLRNCLKIMITVAHLIWNTFKGNKIADHPDVVGASSVGVAPATYSFSTKHLASMDWAKKINCKMRRETFNFWDLVQLIL